MKERPILFTGPMVRAIRDGRKTQTRRPINFKRLPLQLARASGIAIFAAVQYCPYGGPGDVLWVRETWAVADCFAHAKPSDLCDGDTVLYRADYADGIVPLTFGPWRPSIHMPRWACRQRLLLTDVRVQQVRDISEDDALTEGCDNAEQFGVLWGNCYGHDTWLANSWVWALTFEKLEG